MKRKPTPGIRKAMKADRELEEEIERQEVISFAAAVLAMHRYYGWTRAQLLEMLEHCAVICKDCSSTNQLSLIQMLDEETGIELQNGDDRSWKELAYLNASLKPGQQMTTSQWIYMRNRQKKWVEPQLMACILLGLHRMKGYGFTSLKRIYSQIAGIEAEYGWNKDALHAACLDATGISAVEYVNQQVDELMKEGEDDGQIS
jgi:hypothetical protein